MKYYIKIMIFLLLDEILYKNYDFFIVSTENFSDEIIAYFLFLKKIEKD